MQISKAIKNINQYINYNINLTLFQRKLIHIITE